MPQRTKPAVLTPDLCVIGGGTAGHSIGLAAAALGLSCVVVDPRARLGSGQAADLARTMLLAAAAEPDPATAFAALRERTGRAIGTAAANFGAERLGALGAALLRSEGRFLDRRTLRAGSATIRARRFVIATGGLPTIPAIEGRGLAAAMTLDTVGALAACPKRLVVLGGAPAALDYALAFRRFGAEVMLCRSSERPDGFDPELLSVVEAGLRHAGVEIVDRPALRVEPHRTDIEVTLDGTPTSTLLASHLLLAAGTTPAIEGLDLDRAGVSCRDGAPLVGRDLRTTNRRIFAIGDVLGAATPEAAAIQLQVGAVLRAAFFHQPVRYEATLVPRLIRTTPGLATCGLSESEARRRGGDLRILRWPLSENDRAVATGATAGQIKVMATPRGRLLGVGIVGPQAGEMIAPWVTALRQGVPLGAMASLPFPADSLSDASRRVALGFVTSGLRSPWIRRALRLLRLFG